MELKYSKVQARQIQEATIEIYGGIGEKVQGDYLASEINYQDKSADTMFFRINSMGGNFVQGLSIISAITGAKSKTVSTIEGIAGSMAGFIALSCGYVKMNDYARLMLHAPYFLDENGDKAKNLTPDEINALTSLKGIVVDLLTRRGKTKDEVNAILSKDTWYTAKEAETAGFVDEVIDTGVAKSAAGLSVDQLVAFAMKTPPNPPRGGSEEENVLLTNIVKMKKIAAKLGLAEESDELAIIAAIDLKDTNLAAARTKLVDSCIAAGKKSGTITDLNETQMKRLAVADLDLFIDLVMKPAEAKVDNTRISEVIAKLNEVVGNHDPKPEKDWDWYQKNAVAELKAMKAADLPKYKKLYKEYWGSDLKD
jgi:ATP-dependent protease ClpP protease subunit